MKKQRIYAVYKGDNFKCMGTADEISKILGIKKRSVQFMTTKTYAKRREKSTNSLIIFKVEDIDDEE